MKDIKNYEGLYAVTEDGKVWSYKSKKFLRPRAQKNGYLTVALCKEGKPKNYLLHRLVCEAFNDNPNNYLEVNHLSEDKTDNRAENLVWTTHRDNINYGTHNKRSAQKRSKPIYCLELNKTFSSINSAARELSLADGNICDCLNNKNRRKTVGGYHWRYVNE